MARRNSVTLTGLLLAVLLLGTSLRLCRLDQQGLWHDEIITAKVSEQDVSSILQFSREQAGNPPLYFLITHFSFAWLGHSEFAARLPAVLFGTASVLLTYVLGQQLWSKRVGLVGAFLLGINAYHIQYSQEARPYSLMVFLILLSLVFLIKALETNRVILWIGFVVSTALSLYAHYFAFLVLPGEAALGLWTLVREWRRYHRKTDSTGDVSLAHAHSIPVSKSVMFCASLILIVALYIPWASTLLAQFPKQLNSDPVGTSPANLQLALDYLGEVIVAYCGAGGALLFFWVVVVVAGLATTRREVATLATLWIAIPFVFLSVVQSTHFLHPRYLLFILPVSVLLAANGVTWSSRGLERALPGSGHSRKRLLPITVTLWMLVLAVSSAAPLVGYYEGVRGDWREVALLLSENMAPRDVVLADGAGYYREDSITVKHNLSYYLERFGRADTPVLQVKAGLAEALSETMPGTGGELWVVLMHEKPLLRIAGTEDTVTAADYKEATIIRLRQPSLDVREDAVVLLHTMIEILPASEAQFDIHLALAGLYDEMGKSAEAAMHFELAAWTMPAQGSAWLGLAESYRQRGRADDAVDQYLAFLQTPIARSDRRWQRDAYWGLAVTYEQSGMLREAVEAYEKSLNADPAYWQSYMGLGNVYRNLEEPDRALAAYHQAIEMQPQNAWLYLLLGETYRELGNTEKAMEAYQQTLRLDPSSEWAQNRVQQFSQSLDENIPNRIRRSLGMELALLGYDLDRESSDTAGTLGIVLWWRALAKMDLDYTVFIHLVGSDGHVVAQQDRLLQSGDRATSSWSPGEVVRDEYQIHLPQGAHPDEYSISLGVYYWATGDRLPVWDEDGHSIPGGTVTLSPATEGGL